MNLRAKKHDYTKNILNISAEKQDFSAYISVNKAVIRLVKGGADNIIINIESTAYIDNTFVNMLIDSGEYCNKAGCTLSVCGITPDILCAFYLLKLDKRIELYETADDALHRENRLVRRNFRVI